MRKTKPVGKAEDIYENITLMAAKASDGIKSWMKGISSSKACFNWLNPGVFSSSTSSSCSVKGGGACAALGL
jgi:hypothetical protein